MDEAEFDAIIARSRNPDLIPGIYNYCDRSCARCAFTARCLSYLETRREEQDRRAGRSGAAPVAALVGRSLGRAFEMMQIIARREGIDLSMTEEELADAEREQAEQDRRLEADPALELGRRYCATAWPIVRALSPVVATRGDQVTIEAVDRIAEICGLIPAKIHRALSATFDPAFDPADDQTDASGSAKVARLLIADSRAAWRQLMDVGRATADGVPAQLVRLLDELDAVVATRFPRAMMFVRPGFDELVELQSPVNIDP